MNDATFQLFNTQQNFQARLQEAIEHALMPGGNIDLSLSGSTDPLPDTEKEYAIQEIETFAFRFSWILRQNLRNIKQW